MTDKEKVEVLKQCFEDVIPWAIRYAHGRKTYSPSIVRRAVGNFKKVFPEWKPQDDPVIHKITPQDKKYISDYLNDLFD